ncbi:MAG: type III-B CRISPR module RAMP protein Cmr6 [Desulfobacterales bacterium]|nr:type III-B CRISPR module RAMP protein Cmr6 [Desulfobacterales bacterium]
MTKKNRKKQKKVKQRPSGNITLNSLEDIGRFTGRFGNSAKESSADNNVADFANTGHSFFVKNEDVPEITLDAFADAGRQNFINGIAYKEYFDMARQNSKNDSAESRITGFYLKTTYPGLITGTGYMRPHLKESDFQMVFYFDWTTGLPVLPGSTVKGVLRDIFPLKKNNDEKKIAKSNYLAEKLNTDKSLTLTSIEKLENSIFEDKGDVFYDAYIIPEKNVKIFEEDYITPHPSPFSNPIPLRFLKIGPGVTFKFQFKFKESKIDDILVTPKDKKELFKKILLDFGIGAKRNTGYGVLIENRDWMP